MAFRGAAPWFSSFQRWVEGGSATKVFGVCIFLDFVVGLASGLNQVSLYKDGFCCSLHLQGWLVFGLIDGLGMLTTMVALLTSGVSFGSPDMGPGRRRAQLLMGIWSITYTAAFAIPLLWFPRRQVSVIFSWGPFWLITNVIGIRGWPLVAGTPVTLVFGILLPNLTWLRLTLVQLVPVYTRYRHDQRLVFFIMAQPVLANIIGTLSRQAHLGNISWTLPVICVAWGFLVPYGNLLLRRRRRFLPPGLQKVKFVRLGYLRRLFAERGRIRRCQDLPEDAFGDAGKAAHVVILSHRWLDKYRCDVLTDEQPCGLKLEALLQRLERHFQPSCSSRCFWGGALRWHNATCVGGWDVVVFFDFMSVPQPGLDAVGEVVPRTPAELATFRECLPHMGVLYSLFPVLALTDVPRGDTSHEYFGSGWCLCEFSIAMLGKQLRLHSEQLLDNQHSLAGLCSMQMSADAAQKFRQSARAEFAAMHFTHDSDRVVAQDVLEGFLVKRMLLDLTLCGNTKELERILVGLTDQQRLAVLEQPVDALLNTLLHVAVQAHQPKVVLLFLSLGAQPTASNIRGDTPVQHFAFPRLGAAAATCRSWRGKTHRDALTAQAKLDACWEDLGSVNSELTVYSV